MRVCIVGASGKLGHYMIQHALDNGYEVVGVCCPQSVPKLDRFKGRITVVLGMTDDRDVISSAVAGCNGVLVMLAPWGTGNYSSGTAQAVLDYAPLGARLVFSCGWHISRDGKDVYSRGFEAKGRIFGWVGRLLRIGQLDDQVEALRRVFASDTRWTVVRGSDLEEGETQGCRSGAATSVTRSSRATSRGAWTSHCSWSRRSRTTSSSTKRPAIVRCRTPSALAHASGRGDAEGTPRLRT